MAQVAAAGASLQNLVKDGASGLEKVLLKHSKGSSAQVYLHGAHLTSWKTPDGRERLFVSRKAVYKPPKAIRGGVPLCFPQFGGFGPLPAHGFARNTAFRVESGADSHVTLLLEPSQDQLQAYPHPFELRVKVELEGEAVTETLSVTNVGDSDLQFTTAMHTYFPVSGIDRVRIEGLSGLAYLDNLEKHARKTDAAPFLTFAGEVDRIYLDTPGTLRILDDGSGEALVLSKTNLPDAVAWNPWVEKAKSFADYDPEEYKEMVCLEAAAAGSGPVTLGPGKEWHGSQKLSIDKL